MIISCNACIGLPSACFLDRILDLTSTHIALWSCCSRKPLLFSSSFAFVSLARSAFQIVLALMMP